MNNEWTDPYEQDGLDWDHGSGDGYPAANFDNLNINNFKKRFMEEGKQYLHKHITTGNYTVYRAQEVEGFEFIGDVDEILAQNENLKRTNEALEFQLRQSLL